MVLSKSTRLIVATSTSSPSTDVKQNNSAAGGSGAKIGGIVGGVLGAALLICFALLVYMGRKHKKAHGKMAGEETSSVGGRLHPDSG